MRPPLNLPRELAQALDARREGLSARVQAAALELARPCVYITSRRVSSDPLRRGPLARMLGRSTSAPVLPAVAGKFGGTPYAEEREDWTHHEFLGQFDLTAAGALLGMPRLHGLLRIDTGFDGADFRVRWFDAPDPGKVVEQRGVRSVGKWEAAHVLNAGWSLPRDASWFGLLPDGDADELWDAWNDWAPAGYDEDASDEAHRLLGAHLIDDYYDEVDASAFAPLLRVTFDNVADFGWGTNWIYVLTPHEDLERGELRDLLVTGGNS